MFHDFLNVSVKSQIEPDSFCFLKFDVFEQNGINLKLVGFLECSDNVSGFGTESVFKSLCSGDATSFQI